MLKALYKKYVESKLVGEKWGAFLKFYQYLVRAFMANPEYGIGSTGNSRGLLLWHTVGMGKTFGAIAVMLALWDDRQPVIVLPKALQGNFKESVERAIAIIHAGDSEADIAARQKSAVTKLKFVSIDAYNMADQVSRVGVKGESGVAEGTGSLDGKILIVDEAHNLFRAIINSPAETANARRLYDMVMEAQNLRLLFLTGTPAVKDPFELVPCFNMLAGRDLLPPQYEVFYRLYVDKPTRRVKNRAKLANRLMGMVSHVTHSLPTEPPDSEEAAAKEAVSTKPRLAGGFPEELPTVIERVEMAPDQYRRYLLIREKEDAEGKGGEGGPRREALSGPALALPGSEKKSMRSYYVKSRAMSNFAPPRDATKDVDSLPDDAFTEESSPKTVRMVKRIGKSPGSVLVYSQFREMGGLKVIARFLKKAGYTEFRVSSENGLSIGEAPHGASQRSNPSPHSGESDDETGTKRRVRPWGGAQAPPSMKDRLLSPLSFQLPAAPTTGSAEETEEHDDDLAAEPPDLPSVPTEPAPAVDIPDAAKRYAIISGEVPLKDRLRIQAVFNSPANIRGAIIRVLLVTKTGAEGLDLKNVRQTHQLEPYWDKARNMQLVGRAARMGSHDALPEAERDVQPFLYISVPNSKVREGTPEANREAKTIDEMFNERATERYELIQDFRRLLQSVCIECSVMGFRECRMCVPTNEPLFHDDPAQDISLADPCDPMVETDIEATPITVTGKDGAPKTYYYVKDPSEPIGYRFFEWNKAVDGYAPVDPADPIISVLLRTLSEE